MVVINATPTPRPAPRVAHSAQPARPTPAAPTPVADGTYFMSAIAVGNALGLSRHTIYEMVQRGHFETLKYGRRRLIFARSVEQVAREMAAGKAGPYPYSHRRPQPIAAQSPSVAPVRAIGPAPAHRVET